ncbi:creatininase family protein [Dongia sp.]|uniref:creatininase family protein n=1 Tax=Dongia sp. TaxID=1977262 RepID=UPI0035B18280
MKLGIWSKSLLLCGVLLAGFAKADPLPEVDLERLTSPEVRSLLGQGWTTIIIPTGGTEQNGPQLVLGKHSIIVQYTAREIARRLGNTLVAPVMAYVPEGNIDPPEGHMRSPGTISLPEPVFAQVLDASARSFIATGFKTVLFIGDSGGNQSAQEAVAEELDAAFAQQGIHVFTVGDYYGANGQAAWLEADGESGADIGTHAGIRETSELLAIDPTAVRTEMLAPGTDWSGQGASGRPDHASAARGQKLLELKISAALRQIHRLTGVPE